ncbi:site-specific integrase [Lignipirellula cremea]|uniref:site-specific integrase n=1 Tax=Lignipirellula cremea TaxID=2528010 RepID=UPI00119EF3A7|nr:site-specific integrase [Lignipirellula cremea]
MCCVGTNWNREGCANSRRKPKNGRLAERAAAKLEADLQQGRYQEPQRISWEEFRERYETEKTPSLSPRSAHAYSTALNAYERLMKPKRLSHVTTSQVSKFQVHLREAGLREATIANRLRHLKAAFRWAASMGLLAKPPKIQMPKRAKGSKMMKGRPITTRECVQMLRAVESVVGPEAAPSWRFYLRGILKSCVLEKRKKAAHPADVFTLQPPDVGTRIRHESEYNRPSFHSSRRRTRFRGGRFSPAI